MNAPAPAAHRAAPTLPDPASKAPDVADGERLLVAFYVTREGVLARRVVLN